MALSSVSTRTITVGTTPIRVAEELEPSQRKFIAIVNTSTGGQIINVSLQNEASTTVGVPLGTNGNIVDSASGDEPDAYFPSEFQYTAVSSAVGGQLTIIERIGTKVR